MGASSSLAFCSAGQRPMLGLTLLLPFSNHCPQFLLLGIIYSKGECAIRKPWAAIQGNPDGAQSCWPGCKPKRCPKSKVTLPQSFLSTYYPTEIPTKVTFALLLCLTKGLVRNLEVWRSWVVLSAGCLTHMQLPLIITQVSYQRRWYKLTDGLQVYFL